MLKPLIFAAAAAGLMAVPAQAGEAEPTRGEAKLAKDLRRSCTDLSRNAIKARYGLKERVREALPEKSFSAGDLRALVAESGRLARPTGAAS